MNNKGIAPLIAIALIAIIGGGTLWSLNASGLLGLAKQGESCGLPLPKPCMDGTLCYSGVCTPTVSGGIDRFLYNFSLSNIFCRGNILASASCNIVINLGAAVILAVLAIVLVALILSEIPSTPILIGSAVVGGILGLAGASILNYWWHVLVIIIVVLVAIAYKLEVFK